MGILDEAIREHLELKRQHGAEEKEIEGLEAEAFGPADRPDAVEAETKVLSPEQAAAESVAASGAPPAEHPVPAAPESSTGKSADGPDGEGEGEASADVVSPPAPEETSASTSAATPPPEATEPMPPADPVGATVPDVVGEPAATADDFEDPGEEGDAGDMLEAERHRLASHPTEHYDVDAAIAEEDELDVLSESSLSDELDRALEGPTEPVSKEFAADPESDDEPVTADPPRDGAAEEVEDAEFEAVMDAAPEDEPEDENLEDQEEDDSTAEFFDQEDPLEGTPDFLEETPDHDRLWFEQKEPKDFDFGD